MKKIALPLIVGLLIACGGSTKKKTVLNLTVQKEETKAVQAKTATPVDLNNKGVGPIKDLQFEDAIDASLVETEQPHLSKMLLPATKQTPN